MTGVNIDILGIGELRWTGMGEFNSDGHYIYYCRQESLRRNGVAIMVNESPKCSTWMQSQKRQNDLCSFPRQTIQYHGNPAYAPTSNTEEAEVEWFYENLWELTPRKDVLFIIGDWNAKVGIQETPGVTGRFGLGVHNEAGQRLTKFCSKFSKQGFNSMWNMNFQMFKLDLEKIEEPKIKLLTSIGSIKNKRITEKHPLLLY